eukprot:g2839.t1
MADGHSGHWLVRTPMMFNGYLHNPSKTQEAFRDMLGESWFKTGDVAVRRPDGRIQLLGRADNMIPLAHGWNVFPQEIEHIFLAHPAVAEAVVIGTKIGARCNVVSAIIVAKPDYVDSLSSDAAASTALMEELLQSLRGQLAPYKHPERLALCHEEKLPRSLNRKVQYKKLANLCDQGLLPIQWHDNPDFSETHGPRTHAER